MKSFFYIAIAFCVACNPKQLGKVSSESLQIGGSDSSSLSHDPSPEKESQAINVADESVAIPAQITGAYLYCMQGETLSQPADSSAQEVLCSVRDQSTEVPVDIYKLGIDVSWSFQGSIAIKSKLDIQPLVDNVDYHVRFKFQGLTAAEVQELETYGQFGVAFSDGNVVLATAKTNAPPSTQTSNPPSTQTSNPPSTQTSNPPVAVPIACPSGYIKIPGDPAYKTNDFCVMKYEAKNLGGVAVAQAADSPWINVSQTTARTACMALGPGYDLLGLNEWNTIAANIAGQDVNWNGGKVGSGSLFTGHTDANPNQGCQASRDDKLAFVETDCTPRAAGGGENDEATQRRTHYLSNGEVIWDLAGNIEEWVNYNNSSAKPYVSTDGGPINGFLQITSLNAGFTIMQLKDIIPTKAVKPFWNDTWNSNQGIGSYNGGTNGTGGALARGGHYGYTPATGGIFSVYLLADSNHTSMYMSFRCQYVGAPKL